VVVVVVVTRLRRCSTSLWLRASNWGPASQAVAEPLLRRFSCDPLGERVSNVVHLARSSCVCQTWESRRCDAMSLQFHRPPVSRA
jgi:hypothetical protein